MSKKLATHISLLVTSLLSASLIVLAIVIILVSRRDSENHFQNDLSENVNLISTSVAEPLYTFNQVTLRSIITPFANLWDQSILGVKIIDQDNQEIMSVVRKSMDSLSYNDLRNRYPHSIKSRVIKYEGKKLGYLEVIYSYAYFNSEINKNTYAILIYTLLAIIILFIFFTTAFNRLISLPLNKLITEISKLRQNDYSAKVEGNFNYELEKIASDFNNAMEGIRKRDEMINEYATALELMVENRTKERDEQTLKAVNSARLASLGEMSAGIAHEINNPLTVISGLAMQLGKRLEKEGEKFKDEAEKISKIRSMVNRIQKIIEGMKRVSRDGSKEIAAEFDLHHFLTVIKDLTNYKMLSGTVEFTLNTHFTRTKFIAQEIQLSQVIINLLNNSVDAVSELPYPRWITLDVTEKDDKMFFTITDCGHGIPLEVREKMLNPFFTTKEKGKGTGLGLSIAIEIINSHGGQLYYLEDSKNTKFEFYIPIK